MQHRTQLLRLFSPPIGLRQLSPQVISKKRRNRPKSHHVAPLAGAPRFKAGDIVPESGIYETIHEHGHRGPHEVVMINADLFPTCETCADRVRFRLIRSAPYIFDDMDFGKQE